MQPIRLAWIAAAACLTATSAPAAGLKTAVFAGGCFWSAEHDMAHVKGVRNVVSGYAGGPSRNPTYKNHEGHLEVIRVTYDPAQISYAALTRTFLRQIDPTDGGGQFCDRGPSYRTAIFYGDEAERQAAQAATAEAAKVIGKTIATQVRAAAPFWTAEAYHQDYAARNPVRYNAYRIGCGRDRRVKAVWGGR
jgi:peptide-methionine (S)-S-oxide reductase